MPIYITEDEEYSESPTVQKDEDFILANETALEEESDEYQRGYINALTAQQQQYSLRNRDVPINLIQKKKEATPPKNDSPNVQKKGKEPADPTISKTQSANEKPNKLNASKEKTEKKDDPLKEVEKTIAFNLDNEISKLKVSIPLTKLMKNSSYKGQVSKILNIDLLSDMVNVDDDQPELTFGLALEVQSEDSDVAPVI